ncbi:MAG: SpoIIE family protein phosphatase, partial [Anaerolineae bacterium]|nr:SpoIIE family protein phosphatase [Anaerolineae bacterium]
LWVKERLIGALVLERQGAGPAYGEEEVQVASAFASQAAVAIENARLYEGEQQRARQLATIAEVGKRVASILDLDELFDQIVHLVQAEFGYYHVSLFTVDSDSGSPVFRASTSEVSASSILPIPAGKGIIGWVAANGEALLANDVQQEPRYVADDTLPATRAELAVPLKFEGRTVGVLDIQGDQPGAFKPEDLFVMQTLADQVAVAIENARLYVAQQEQAWISTALLQVAELAGRTRDLDEILAGLVRLTPMLVGVDRCSVYLWDRAAQRYLAAQGHSLADGAGERLVGRSYRVGDLPLLDRVRVTGEPVVLEEVAGSGLLPEAFAREAGMVSVLALPLRSQDEVLGIMLVDYVARQHRFPQQQVVLLTGIANEAALAIENVRLYRESLEGERIAQELRVARQIQATFLPESAPTLAGWSIAGASRPAREVGGDFYDFIHLRMHRLGLVIADVSDKGVPAALFMALSRTVMRAVAAEGQSPAAALKRANALLLADSRSGMFVTLFYGILDSESGELVYASAGHTPAYWYQHDAGRLARLVRRGVPLGVVEQPYFEEGRIILQPGDLLLLYSDGVTESLDPEMREFGEEGLRAAILAAAAQRAPEVVAAIDEAVERFARGTPQFDDYTLLALSRDR